MIGEHVDNTWTNTWHTHLFGAELEVHGAPHGSAARDSMLSVLQDFDNRRQEGQAGRKGPKITVLHVGTRARNLPFLVSWSEKVSGNQIGEEASDGAEQLPLGRTSGRHKQRLWALDLQDSRGWFERWGLAIGLGNSHLKSRRSDISSPCVIV
jgi:hypothetical protein